jgi:hypothetical protein
MDRLFETIAVDGGCVRAAATHGFGFRARPEA